MKTVAEVIDLLRRFPANAEVSDNVTTSVVYTKDAYDGQCIFAIDTSDEMMPLSMDSPQANAIEIACWTLNECMLHLCTGVFDGLDLAAKCKISRDALRKLITYRPGE